MSGVSSKNEDITSYIFEMADYCTLNSYIEAYPYGKSYALYYTQGTKNIYGLNFKVPDVSNGALGSLPPS